MQGAGKHAYRDWPAFVEDALEARKRQTLDLTEDVARPRRRDGFGGSGKDLGGEHANAGVEPTQQRVGGGACR